MKGENKVEVEKSYERENEVEEIDGEHDDYVVQGEESGVDKDETNGDKVSWVGVNEM